MARKPRIHIAGALYHVILRGNNGQFIFRDDKDRYRLQDLVSEGARRFHYHVLGYCWMGNHIHAALQVDQVTLSKAMHHLSFRYTRYFNRRHKRIGHVFQGRYKAILVDSDSYLLQLVRYIHLNPVRARLVDDPAAWPWSSHRAYIGDGRQAPWLETEPVLARFGSNMPRARTAYSRFMAMPEEMMPAVDFKRGNQKIPVLGDGLFAQRLSKQAGLDSDRPRSRTSEIVDAVCLAAGIVREALGKSRRAEVICARSAAAHLVEACGDGNFTALARLLSRDPSTLSRAAARYARCEAAEVLAERARTILTNASLHA